MERRPGIGQDRSVLEVAVRPRSLEDLAGALTAEQAERLGSTATRAVATLSGRVVWNVSSTATGGGVAEMLRTLLGYVGGAGMRTRWQVLDGDPEFFRLTKGLHNAMHGAGDGTGFDADERAHYERVLLRNLPDLLAAVSREDVVILHDPQTAGLLGPLRRAGVPVVWRCHIGRDAPNPVSEAAWEFLRPYVEPADTAVFSRRQYAPPWIPADRLWVIPPSIDPLSAKNRPIPAEECVRILLRAGLLGADGSTGPTTAVPDGPPPPPDARLVIQVSRWDRLKDMTGVIRGFARAAAADDVHLMLVGPDVAGVTDDPEGAEVLADCVTTWRGLPPALRARVHLASVPMDDPEKNATIVNAVQRHAAVVVQKSLAEGFGLTVTEAMWKARPVVASAVGGIQDQISDGEDGVLVPDPHDLSAFGAAVGRLLADPPLARRLGDAAHRTVGARFLGDRHLEQYADLVETVLRRSRTAEPG
jgi:trehalose synthase